MRSSNARFFYSRINNNENHKNTSAPTIPFTLHEKIPLLCNSAIGATGVGGSIIPGTIMFFSASEKAGGLGLFALSSLGLGALLGIGLGSLILTLATGYYAYHELRKEAEKLNEDILAAFHKQEAYHLSLFLYLLQLKFLSTEDEYKNIIKDLCLEIHPELDLLIKTTHQQLIAEDTSSQHKIFSIKHHDEMIKLILATLPKNKPNTKDADDDDFFSSLHTSYHQHDEVSVSYKKAIIHGILVGTSIPLTSLGTIWLFSALVIGSGIAASIPIIGWAILGASCLILGIALGVSYGLAKHTNVKREAIHHQLNQQNQKLEHQIKQVKNTHSNLLQLSFLSAKKEPQTETLLRKQERSFLTQSY